MFAPRYEVQVGELTIEMGPPKDKAEIELLAELMSNPKITRYMGVLSGFTPDDEAEWYEKVRTSKDDIVWTLFDITDGKRTVIGNTALHGSKLSMKTFVSGFQLSRPEYWGKGIAGATHRVRTWHAFNREGAICIRSAVIEPNVGSRKALESVGYVVVGVERNIKLDDGHYENQLNLECINPNAGPWREWWHGDSVPKKFREARSKTQAAIEWVREEVKPFE